MMMIVLSHHISESVINESLVQGRFDHFQPGFCLHKKQHPSEFAGGVLYLTPLNSKTLERVI